MHIRSGVFALVMGILMIVVLNDVSQPRYPRATDDAGGACSGTARSYSLEEPGMLTSVSHIALFVPDLQEAERFYEDLFEMDLIGREVEQEDGLWYTLPFDKGWEDAKAAGIVLDMTALRKGGFVLALFRGTNPPGQVFAIGLSTSREDIKAIHDRLPADMRTGVSQPDHLEFTDPYHITWQIAVEPAFRTAGDWANRWVTI